MYPPERREGNKKARYADSPPLLLPSKRGQRQACSMQAAGGTMRPPAGDGPPAAAPYLYENRPNIGRAIVYGMALAGRTAGMTETHGIPACSPSILPFLNFSNYRYNTTPPLLMSPATRPPPVPCPLPCSTIYTFFNVRK